MAKVWFLRVHPPGPLRIPDPGSTSSARDRDLWTSEVTEPPLGDADGLCSGAASRPLNYHAYSDIHVFNNNINNNKRIMWFYFDGVCAVWAVALQAARGSTDVNLCTWGGDAAPTATGRRSGRPRTAARHACRPSRGH